MDGTIPRRLQATRALPALLGLVAMWAAGGALAQEDGAKLFEQRCAVCHGALPDAPSPGAMGRMDREQFLAGIDQHENAGGLVSSLSTAEIEAVYDHLSGEAQGGG